MPIDIDAIRAQFPSLAVTDDNRARIYFDNPGGTQVPQIVIDRMTDCLIRNNANLGGYFATSIGAGAIMDGARSAMADFLNAASPDEIVFGQNMTTLTFSMSRSLGRRFGPGDEIVLTRMDHDGNVSPWLLLARDLGLTVKWLDFNPETFEFDLPDLAKLLGPKTRLVAVNHASNATGTINDVKAISRMAKEAGALVYVDSVQYAPHGSIDVQDIGCDFLVCSAYKFFGPHQGILWGRADLLEELEAYKVRPAASAGPEKFETGTQSHEGMAGVTAAVDYFAGIGATMAKEHHTRHAGFSGRRRDVRAAMDLLFAYETSLAERLIDGLKTLPDVTVQGITAPEAMARRVPTISFITPHHAPRELAAALAGQNVFAWSGHNYAVEVIDRLGLAERGGVLRLGLAHYNTAAEVDFVLDALRRVL
ncbi:cysteine desulfurase-like protein [Mesorhizobium sp. LHD-90]|uniref:cysteine desulfurase-like protein n=1 Tax=Mesorhizobium sp. LHD-90 TaxID=3071414 RepID=UPI0027E0467A|nr:cysteine desulfurase-like protein [Mesorhizobium sp. LHD-90]MDQ6434197.1 cysteine desulfurase-like protein [Mesorhizobium sp. LHD-90]